MNHNGNGNGAGLATLDRGSQQTFGLKQFLEQNRDRLDAFASKVVDTETLVRMALWATAKDSKLAECSGSSILLALMDCAAMGLRPDGRQCYMVPYGKQAKAIPGYMGYVDAMYRGAGVTVTAHLIHDFEEFEETGGYDEKLVHKPQSLHEHFRDLNHVLGVYAVAHFPDGRKLHRVRSRKEVLAIKKASKASKGPWHVKDHEPEMWLKTAIRALRKLVPKCDDLAMLMMADDGGHPARAIADVEVVSHGTGSAADLQSRIEALPDVADEVEHPVIDVPAAGPTGTPAGDEPINDEPPYLPTVDEVINLKSRDQATKKIAELCEVAGVAGYELRTQISEFDPKADTVSAVTAGRRNALYNHLRAWVDLRDSEQSEAHS